MQLPNPNKRNHSSKKKIFCEILKIQNCSNDSNHSLCVVLLAGYPREPCFPSDICVTNHLVSIQIKEGTDSYEHAWWIVNRIYNSSFFNLLFPLRPSSSKKPCLRILVWGCLERPLLNLLQKALKVPRASWHRTVFFKMPCSLGMAWPLSLELVFIILASLYRTVGH